jgi:hypothetical protein
MCTNNIFVHAHSFLLYSSTCPIVELFAAIQYDHLNVFRIYLAIYPKYQLDQIDLQANFTPDFEKYHPCFKRHSPIILYIQTYTEGIIVKT